MFELNCFDKDDVEALDLMKLDLLFLRMLSAARTSVEAISVRDPKIDYDRVPDGNPAMCARLRRGETVGAFQLESPAQARCTRGPTRGPSRTSSHRWRSSGPGRLRIRTRRSNPFEKTYGVVLYLEQVIEIAGFTPGEVDSLRRVLSSFRSQAEIERIGEQFLQKAIERGIEPEKAEEISA